MILKMDEQLKHIKKKGSSTSKANIKSKHKHNYIDCLLIVSDHGYPHKATYCNICGKINNLHFWEVELTKEKYYRQLDKDEVYEKYKGLKQFIIRNLWDKYIPEYNQKGECGE